ncbi:DUF1491 family protein [Sphingomonas jaspsi]|uniref:DUF1491 family protein n=1 Tax=Sphingomonas jaspsi TaxID=392409 RepID=UPI0004B60BF1|nr:DUF1491 family protein [Sphingomonas jaspsi]
MSDARLTPSIEADSLIRQAQQAGGFGAVLRKGDPQRGAVILIITDRGKHMACLERQLQLTGDYRWARSGPGEDSPSSEVSEWARKRVKFDEDVWLIELDIPHPERFIVDLAAIG